MIIYSAINSVKIKVDWEIYVESEWLYIGLENEINENFIIEKIAEIFANNRIFILLGRDNSKETGVAEFQSEVFNRIGKVDFMLNNERFTRFMEFNKIRVFRIGKLGNKA
jgi:hypothetical protein